MGVMIGLYGNWLIQLLDKIQNQNWLSQVLFTLSFLPFILFFKEVFSGNPTWLKFISLKLISGAAYIFIVYGAIFTSELPTTDYFFAITGFLLWFVLLQTSIQG